nr:Gfo/Idh/MocA family oxidoreductase [Butyrivibrio sp. NC2007]
MFGRLKVAIMGTGKIAGTMAETLKETKGVTCYAVGSRTLENAEKFARDYGFKKAYGSYAELVADPKVDLIYVATPHSEHYENVKLAISAGRNVICEKAFMLNEKQAKKIFEFAEEEKVLVTEAIWTRYMPMRTKLMEILASNVIGEPTMLTANLSYNIAYKERIQKPELGGGALLDLGVYCLHFASMVFGNDVKDIASICTFNNLGMDMQDSITLRYADGKMAVLNATVLSTGDRNGVIYGSKGFIVVENINNPEAIAVYDNNYNKTAYYKRPKQKTGYEYEIEACVKAIGEGWLECPDIPHAETLKILNMMDFIRNNNHIVFPGEDDNSEAIETPAETTDESVEVIETIPETEAEASEEISEAVEQGEYEEEVNSGDDTSGTDV